MRPRHPRKLCPVCYQVVEDLERKYCSRLCAAAERNKANAICPVCKKGFHAKKSDGQRYCSMPCARVAQISGPGVKPYKNMVQVRTERDRVGNIIRKWTEPIRIPVDWGLSDKFNRKRGHEFNKTF